MKLSECNARQRKAYINVYHACNWIIGGWENAMEDNPEDSEEYKGAKAWLDDREALMDYIYSEVISTVYHEGAMFWGAGEERYLKDIRFCGKAWIMERIDKRLKKMGY